MRATPFPFIVVLTLVGLQACAQTQSQAQPQTQQDLNLRTGTQPPADNPKPAVDGTPPPMRPAPKLTDTETERFLTVANVLSQKKLDSGTTAAIRATLSDGKLTHDAQFQPIDIYKPVFRGAEGT